MNTAQQKFQENTLDMLFDQALTAKAADREPILSEIQWRGSSEALSKAIELSKSRYARHRLIAATILGRLGIPRSFPKACLARISEMLADPRESVVLAATKALADLNTPDTVPYLIAMSPHKISAVRVAAAVGLVSHTHESAVVETLSTLAQDPVESVRNWATFALARSDVNSEEVVALLNARSIDEHVDTRQEAIYGLAKRNMPNAGCLILRDVARNCLSELLVQSARALVDNSNSVPPHCECETCSHPDANHCA